MYSFHSSPEEKNKLLHALTQHGIETTVDRIAKKKRIRDWIQESIIQEDDEDVEDVEFSVQTSRKPIAGHVSSVRVEERMARKHIVTTVKDASNKHINPRTGKVQQGPSKMGHHNSDLTELLDTTTNALINDDRSSHYTIKLVDVASQTSNELGMPNDLRPHTSDGQNSIHGNVQKAKTESSQNSDSCNQMRTQSAQRTHRNIINTDSILCGLNLTSNRSVATRDSESSNIGDLPGLKSIQNTSYHGNPQPRQFIHQMHNPTALTKQPISRSICAFNSLTPDDSGYGSLDKLRPIDGNSVLSSPVFSKRSIIQPNVYSMTNDKSKSGNKTPLHINGLSHSQNEGSSPFQSESSNDASPCGSNGFVNFSDITPTQSVMLNERINPNIPTSMKDTAYDRVQIRKKIL